VEVKNKPGYITLLFSYASPLCSLPLHIVDSTWMIPFPSRNIGDGPSRGESGFTITLHTETDKKVTDAATDSNSAQRQRHPL
jgi:hypothetical protein